MNYIFEKLEEHFFSLPYEDYCDQELVRLLSLDTNEVNQEYQEHPERFDRYLKTKEAPNRIMQVNEPETESDSESEEPIKVNTKVGRTNDPQFPKEEPESSSYRNKKRKQSEFKMPMHNGIPNSTGKTGVINVLNIDCVNNLKERKILVDKWITEISLIIQTNPSDFVEAKQVILLLEHKTDGNLQKFFKQTNWNSDLHGQDLFDQLINILYSFFLGIDYVDNKALEIAKRQHDAERNLTQLQLKNICYLDDFTCLYEKYLYDITDAKQYMGWVLSYLMKLPIISERCIERFNKEAISDYTKNSLIFANRIAKEEIEKICKDRFQQKQLKSLSKNCCDFVAEMQNLTIGKKDVFHKKQKKKKYKKYKTFYKKKRRSFQPGKYFKKPSKHPTKIAGSKDCPQGKKKCRCWICSEEGHYANECPNRSKFPEKVKEFITGISDGYQPLEEEFDGLEDVYRRLEIIESSDDNSDSNNESTETD